METQSTRGNTLPSKRVASQPLQEHSAEKRDSKKQRLSEKTPHESTHIAKDVQPRKGTHSELFEGTISKKPLGIGKVNTSVETERTPQNDGPKDLLLAGVDSMSSPTQHYGSHVTAGTQVSFSIPLRKRANISTNHGKPQSLAKHPPSHVSAQDNEPNDRRQLPQQDKTNEPRPRRLTDQLSTYLPHLSDNTKCANCGDSLTRYVTCQRCLYSRYCGKYCQIWDWQLHSLVCSRSVDASKEEVDRLESWAKELWKGAVEMLKVNSMREEEPIRPGDSVEKEKGEVSARADEGEDNGSQHDEEVTEGSESMEISDGGSEYSSVEKKQGVEPAHGGQEERKVGLQNQDVVRVEDIQSGNVSNDGEEEEENDEDEHDTKRVNRPDSPPSMYWSRAISLHLAQGGKFDVGLFEKQE